MRASRDSNLFRRYTEPRFLGSRFKKHALGEDTETTSMAPPFVHAAQRIKHVFRGGRNPSFVEHTSHGGGKLHTGGSGRAVPVCLYKEWDYGVGFGEEGIQSVNKPRYRILVADDDPIVRGVLRTLLAQTKRFDLVGEASDGQEAVRQTLLLKPDILLLDMLLPLLPGIETLRELTTIAVPVKTILLCSAISKRQIIEALQLGARGAILKDSVAELEPAADAVMAGQYWIHGKAVSNIIQELREITEDVFPRDLPRPLGLTQREMDIISFVTQGISNKEIGKQLGIAEDTVKRHLTHIFDKVGTSTRLELALFAVDRHLVTKNFVEPITSQTKNREITG